MLALYIGCLLVGGVFVLMSMVFGGKDSEGPDSDMDAAADAAADLFEVDHELDLGLDADASADADVELETGHVGLAGDLHAHADVGTHLDGDAGHGVSLGAGAIWLPFLSFKFWTFLLAGFGLTGVLLSLLGDPAGAIVTGLASALVGLVVGTGVAYVLRRLKRSVVDSGIRAGEVVGHTGEVLVRLRPGVMGKIRVTIRGQQIDILAETDEENFEFQRGDEVFVYKFEEGVAQVIHPRRVLWRDGSSRGKRAADAGDPDQQRNEAEATVAAVAAEQKSR